MVDLDRSDVLAQLAALPDCSLSLEKLFLRDNPSFQGCSKRNRNHRGEWLATQIEVPDGYMVLLMPDDDIDQSEWTLTIRRTSKTGPSVTIHLNAHTYFGISHWLMTYGWIGDTEHLHEL